MSKLVSLSVILLSLSVLGYTSLTLAGDREMIALGHMDDSTQFRVQVVKTRADQERGLQGHAPLKVGEGMLFEFDQPAIRCMWNHGVDFPVGVLFLSDQGQPLEAIRMEPNNSKKVCSHVPVRHVLEINPDTRFK